MTLRAFVFPKLQTLKTWLDKCVKSYVFEDPLTSNMINAPNHCSNLHHIYRLLPVKLSCKKSLLWICQILGLLVNTLATDEKYLVLNRDNLTVPSQMQLSQEQHFFSEFFAEFLKLRWNFNILKKKMTLTGFVFAKLWVSKNVVR